MLKPAFSPLQNVRASLRFAVRAPAIADRVLPPSPSGPAPSTLSAINPVRTTGVCWDRHHKAWAYSYYVNGRPPRRRYRGSFSARTFGYKLARFLAEKCRLTAERLGVAVVTDSNRSTRLKSPATYSSDIPGVRWYDHLREWRAEWVGVDGNGLRHRMMQRFPVHVDDDVNEVRRRAEEFRRQRLNELGQSSKGFCRKRPATADFHSGVPRVTWQGPGAGETKNGSWLAHVVFRDPDGKIVRSICKGFSVNKYGFEGAKRLAIEAVRNSQSLT